MLPPYIPQPGHRTTTGSLLRRPRRHIAAAPVAYFLSGAYNRLRANTRLVKKQIVVACMRKLLVLCLGVLKTRKSFDPTYAA